MPAPLRLPRLLHRRIEALAADLLAAPGAPPVDFLRPAGAAALVAPDAVAWRVFANPITLFIGGVAAVLLELAEPRVRHGVWDHSSFRTDPVTRLKRTGLAALVSVYAPAGTAVAMIEAVNRQHAKVAGETAGGVLYRADDPELLVWVQATATWGFLEAYAAYDQPVSLADRDRYYAECAPVAVLYGAAGSPSSQGEAAALLERMRPALESSDTLHEFLRIMRRIDLLPRIAAPLQPRLLKAAIALLPPPIVGQLGLAADWRLAPWERRLVRIAASVAGRLSIEGWPSHQAQQRLGGTNGSPG